VHRNGTLIPSQPHVELIGRVCRFIEANVEEPLTLADLGTEAGISPSHLQRVFKQVTGISPRQYLDACRLGRLKARLKERRTVTMAMFEAGYGSSSRLYERSSTHLGMTPATYQRGGRGARIRYAVFDCPLGRLLLAGTERGVCMVSLGDNDATLIKALSDEYPAAEVRCDAAGLGEWTMAVLRYLDGSGPHLELPLDVQATAFQWRVWEALRAIPYGMTATYSEIAARLGKPDAARAVARACATNPVSLVIPCHRVIREDGSLGGYRWGLDRKQALLDKERAGATQPKARAGAGHPSCSRASQ